MRKGEKIIKQLSEGKTVYLLNAFYSTAIKAIPGTIDYKAKHKGGPEYNIKSSTDLVCETFGEGVEITEKEYLEY